VKISTSKLPRINQFVRSNYYNPLDLDFISFYFLNKNVLTHPFFWVFRILIFIYIYIKYTPINNIISEHYMTWYHY